MTHYVATEHMQAYTSAPILVADLGTPSHTPVSRKHKLLNRLCERPKDFTWDEACALMRQCGFELHNRSGSSRMFVHMTTRQKVGLHEPHPESTLKPYAINYLIEALQDAGEIEP